MLLNVPIPKNKLISFIVLGFLFLVCINQFAFLIIPSEEDKNPDNLSTSDANTPISDNMPQPSSQSPFIEDPNLAVNAPLIPLNGGDTDNWTIMIYMDGDNNLEGASLKDMNEIESIAFDNKGINIIVQIDRAEGFDDSDGDWMGTRRYEAAPDSNPNQIGSTLLEDLGELNMGNGSVLTDFINYSLSHYPAQHSALVLWDHGGGLDGICWDDTSRHDQLSLLEVRQAITMAKNELKNKGFNETIDILGCDACLMATIEVAYEFKDLAEYMVFSEEIEPVDGWPYHLIIDDLANNPLMKPDQLTKIIVERYAESYQGQQHMVTQSAIDLNKIDELAKNVDELSEFLQTQITNEPISGNYFTTYAVYRALNLTQTYNSPGMIDFGDFVKHLESNSDDVDIDAKCNNVTDALNKVVIAEEHGPHRSGSTGLSIHFPKTGTVYKTNFQFKDLKWDEFVESYQVQHGSTGYQNWVSGGEVDPSVGIDVSIYFEVDIYCPDNGTDITVTWYVDNFGTMDAEDVVVLFYESGEGAREDQILIRFYEIDVVPVDSYVWGDLTWQVNVTGWRIISVYIWSMNDVNPSDNEYSDYIWVVPSQGSPTGYCWFNITDEGYPYEGYDNYIYFGVENWGVGDINQWMGNITIFAYSYEQNVWYTIANLSFWIDGWISGYPPAFEDWITWNPNSGGWWQILFIVYYEDDPVHIDDYYAFDTWVIEDQVDLEVILLDYDWPIEGFYGEFDIAIVNYGLTSPGVDAAYFVWVYSEYEASWNDTYDWELIYSDYISGLSGWEDSNYYVLETFDWTPEWGGYYTIWIEVYEDYLIDPSLDNDPIESNNFDYVGLFAISLSPDLECHAMAFDELTYQAETESYFYLEVWNVGLADSLAGDTEIYIYDWSLETNQTTVIYSGVTELDIPAFCYLYDVFVWIPSSPGWHVVFFYAEDISNEYLVDEFNWYYLLIWVEEPPEQSEDVSSSIWESPEDYYISFYSTDVGDIDDDGEIEVVIVGNLTEISTGLEFMGLWIFTYDSQTNRLVLEYQFYWSTGAEETLQAVLVEDLDADFIPEIIIAGFYLNETNGIYYSYLAVCIYDEYLTVVEYDTWLNVWFLSLEIAQLDTDALNEICIVGHYWEWNTTASDWDLYSFVSICSYEYTTEELVEEYFTYWTEGGDSYLTGVELADLDYPVPDGINEIIFSGYFFSETDVYSYIAVYSYDSTTPDLILLDYDFYQDAYLFDVSVGEVDQFEGNEIVSSGYYINATGQYIFTLIYYYNTSSNSLVLQDVFFDQVGENAIITSIDLIDVDNDRRDELLVGGYYYNDTLMKWFAFVFIYEYEYGTTLFDGTLNLEYYIKWAVSNDYLKDLKAVNLDQDDDVECVTVGSADNRGQASIQTIENYYTGEVIWSAEEFEISEIATITVTDTDLDTDPSTIDQVDVQVSSDSDATGITVTLTETGLNTGVFTGTCTFSLTSSNNNLDVLLVTEGDIITVDYDDAMTTNKTSLTISVNALITTTTPTTPMTEDKTTTTTPKSSPGFTLITVLSFASFFLLCRKTRGLIYNHFKVLID